MKNNPKLSVWVTSTGRIDVLQPTIESWINQCTYDNYEMIIIESLMTDVSRKFFDLTYVREEETVKYLDSLPKRFPEVDFKMFMQPFKILGQVYEQLLIGTGDYFLNIEDDLETCCDPSNQIVDDIKLLDADPDLLGIRVDLRDETVYEGCSRFPETLEKEGMKYVIWRQWCSGGAQIMDAKKVRKIGGYKTDHVPKDYIQTEHDQSAKMRAAGMYTGINLKYWGFLKHIGHHGVQGGNRGWSVDLYDECERRGWAGDGKKRENKRSTHSFIKSRVDNGKP